ncbi:UDP-N-acetylmuramate dehydrogenase [Sanyastnella coralliicola]|uniref:UDP-N-acetylmuramate dehydrogenase n=1 Tax=Sanyastnella coralliicola TaxID=3069118 RepID=UPI0027B89311|nr:UDP-N-acetylmuramate dehydrogenase [Longitalea sp. SCSIO 12813]
MPKIKPSHDLQPFHTFGTSATAEFLAEAGTIEDVIELSEHATAEQLKLTILGGGSNVLFTKDVRGLVLLNRITGIDLVGEDDHHFYVRAGAGEVWHDFVEKCISEGWAGVENLALIPGMVGASPMQNIGAYGIEIESVFDHLIAVHLPTGELHQFDKRDCQFGYRESVFKRKFKGQYVICYVQYKLRKKPDFNTSYGAIQQELEKQGVSDLSLRAVADAVIAIRQSKLPDPKEIGNAGSFFKNPVVDQDTFNAIAEEHPELPNYPAPKGKVKLAAGWLIDQSGWKGFREGDFGVHDRQALVLVNHGNAHGREIFDLSKRILKDVEEKFGVKLEREVNIL